MSVQSSPPKQSTFGPCDYNARKAVPRSLESDRLQLPERMEIVIDKIQPAEIFHAVATYAAEKAMPNKRSFAPKIEDVSNKRAKK